MCVCRPPLLPVVHLCQAPPSVLGAWSIALVRCGCCLSILIPRFKTIAMLFFTEICMFNSHQWLKVIFFDYESSNRNRKQFINFSMFFVFLSL